MATEIPETAQTFDRLVRSRRSVRKFTDERIPEEVIEHCIELAFLAPNSSNLQPWHVWWVRDDAQRKALAKACMSQNAARTASDLLVVAARTGTWRETARRYMEEWPDGEPAPIVRKYYTKLAPLMYTVGWFGIPGRIKQVVFSLMRLFRVMPAVYYSQADLKTWAVKSTALAGQNLMMALHAHGYDTCPMEGFDPWRVSRIVGLPRDAYVIMVLGAGRAAEDGIYMSRWRVPPEERTTRI